MAENKASAPDWRASVLQSYRNAEVREIAKVLAALEGSASVTPASKLMLAMRFEDQIFKSAGSLADYRKKISKRLKKLQKNYVRPTTSGPGASAAAATSSSSSSSQQQQQQQQQQQSAKTDDNSEAKIELTYKLQREYGRNLAYIVKNAAEAVQDLKNKLGPEKAKQLQQHTDSCRIWARDLKILSKEELDGIPASIEKESSPESSGDAGTSKETPKNSKDNEAVPLSLAQLQRIEQHLRTRVGNIRSYVVKHADPDRFLQETLQTKDLGFSKNPVAGNLFKESLQRMLSTQKQQILKAAAASTHARSTTEATENEPHDPLLVLQTALEKALAGVPPPTRQDSRMLEGSLRHLDKIRAASQAMVTYWTLPGDQRVATAPRETLNKIHDVVHEGTDFVLEAIRELQKKQQTSKGISDSPRKVSLQDAWSKHLELPSSGASTEGNDTNASSIDNSGSTEGPPPKKPKLEGTNHYKPYIKSRMLFRANRKTPQPLLAAIRRKGARFQTTDSFPNKTPFVSSLVLDFEEAFSMTIYFSPLTVTIRAIPRLGAEDHSTTSVTTWKPLSEGLTPWSSRLDSLDFKHKLDDPNNNLSVWGVTGSYEGIGRVVEERLRDASTHATHTLRKCFQKYVKDKTVDFEVELLEGSALLEFLQIARSTYMPTWEDTDN